MKHAISVVATVATLSIGSAATAAEHVVLIMSDGYFPQITYLDRGDTVQFVNVSETDQNIVSRNNSWAIGPISPNASETMIFDTGVQMTFYNADLTNEDGLYTVEANMSFGIAPLN